MQVTIDVDADKARENLTFREKAAVKVLLIIFGILYPAKYDHQLNKALQPLSDIIGEKKD